MHCPGHTTGSTAFYFEEQNLCCPGDTLFRGSIGRTSWDGMPSLEGTSDSQHEISSIKFKLMTLPEDTRIVAGHGEATTIGRERASNPYVRGR